MKNDYDYSISLIRFIAMCLIIACHFFQYYGNELAWWLNVGVQLFLFISGYLHGLKKINNQYSFIRKNFIKILVPYYLLILFVLILYFVLCRSELSLFSTLKVLLTIGTIHGGEHLWFVKYILLCYFITPFIKKEILENSKKNTKYFLIIILIVTLLLFNNYINLSFVFCYLFGLIYGNIIIKNEKTNKFINYIIIIISFASNISIIYLKYIIDSSIINNFLFLKFCDFSHVFLGVSIFIILKALFDFFYKIIFTKIIIKILSLSDLYSYNIYLAHQFFILGPLSLIGFSSNFLVDIFLILLIIILIAYFNNKFSSIIIKKIINK